VTRSAMLRIITYDISSDKVRRQVAVLLEAEATRVQYSVFEARLSDAALRRIVSRIDERLAENDSLRVYTVGTRQEHRCQVLGAGLPVDRDVGFWLL